MRSILCIAVVMSVALARPQLPLQHSPREATILRYDNDNIGVGGYNFAYETSDGTTRQESAEVKNPGSENEALVVRGTVTWIAADGQEYTITYLADENGFQPQGKHLPH